MQLGSVVYNSVPPSGSFGPITGANNGLSQAVTGKIVLGNDTGGTLATLLSNREIPMAGFQILFSGNGNTATGIPVFRQDAAIGSSTPDMLFQQSNGQEAARIRFFSNVAGDAGSVFIGRNAGALYAAAGGVTLIGFRTGEQATGNSLTGVGYEVLMNTTGNNNQGFGTQALHNITTGIENCAVGRNTLLFADICSQNTAVGNLTGGQVWAGRACDNNCFFGFAAGLASASTAFTATGNVFIGSLCYGNTGGGYGNNNILIGFSCAQAGASGSLGSNCIFIGANIVSSGASNTTIIGQGITCNLSNVCVVGRADQTTIIGNTAPGLNSGANLQTSGVTSRPIRSAAVNATLSVTDDTIILTAGGLVITIPAASAANVGWVFKVVNQAAASTFSANYINFAGAAVNTIAANSAIWIMSNAVAWQRIV